MHETKIVLATYVNVNVLILTNITGLIDKLELSHFVLQRLGNKSSTIEGAFSRT